MLKIKNVKSLVYSRIVDICSGLLNFLKRTLFPLNICTNTRELFLNNYFYVRLIYFISLGLSFIIAYLVQFGDECPSVIVYILPQFLKIFIYENIRLWVVPFIFFLINLLFIFVQYFYFLLYAYLKKFTEVKQNLRQIATSVNSFFANFLLLDFPLSVICFIILLFHVQNVSIPYNISAEIFNILRDNQSLFLFSTNSSLILVILCSLLLSCYVYFIKQSIRELSVNFFNITITFFVLFITLVLIFYCNNLLLLIFLLELLLLLLLNLFRLKIYTKNVGMFLKSILVFIIAQAIATVIYCYGLSLIYVQNPSLSFSTIAYDAHEFSTFYFETHQFIVSGSIYLLIALLIKMGLGPLGLWIFFSVNEFTYAFLILYFSFIKPLYFTIIVKLIGNLFSTLYMIQGLICHPSHLSVNDPKLLEYFKFFLLNQSFKSHTNIELITQLSNNIQLNDLLYSGNLFRENIIFWVLAFSIFSVVIGSFGLLKTNDFKKFIAYSSMLNYGFIFYPIISGYMSSVHYSVIYVFSYSIINLLFIWIFTEIFNKDQNNITNLSLSQSKINILVLFLISLIVSMAGLPPFLGFFIKTAVLFELIKILGPVLGAFFILFTLIGAFGYARLIKNMFGSSFDFKNFNILSTLLMTFNSLVPFKFLILFIFILVFILNTFLGYFLVYMIQGDTLTIFNSFVFNAHFSLKGTFIEHNLLQLICHDLGLDLNEFIQFAENFLINFDQSFIDNVVQIKTDLYIRKSEILTGKSPSIEDINIFKNNLRNDIIDRLHVYSLGDGLEYTKVHKRCLIKFI